MVLPIRCSWRCWLLSRPLSFRMGFCRRRCALLLVRKCQHCQAATPMQQPVKVHSSRMLPAVPRTAPGTG
jgi:hypothetical protein